VGTLSTFGDVMQTTVAGTVVDQYGNVMPGVVICYGSGEEDAVAIAETDAGGTYSAAPPRSFSAGGGLVGAYLPLYRFVPDRVQMPDILLGETTLDSAASPSVYPVPPERDCR
jgi:hypothetical protein